MTGMMIEMIGMMIVSKAQEMQKHLFGIKFCFQTQVLIDEFQFSTLYLTGSVGEC